MCCHIASLYVHFDKVDASLWQNIITTLPHWWIYGAVFKLQALGITCRTQLCLYQINSSIPSPPLTLGGKLLNAFNRYCWKKHFDYLVWCYFNLKSTTAKLYRMIRNWSLMGINNHPPTFYKEFSWKLQDSFPHFYCIPFDLIIRLLLNWKWIFYTLKCTFILISNTTIQCQFALITIFHDI